MATANAPANRWTTFDAIRGIAALGVVAHHLILTWTGSTHDTLQYYLYYTPFEALFSGGKFVRVFFVISGFVLFLPFLKKNQPSWTQFYIRRFCRVWPPMAIVAVAAATLSLYLPPVSAIAGASHWFTTDTRPLEVTLTGLLRHLAMLGTDDSIKLNCVTWSLVHEARIMLIFPLLVVAVLRRDLWCLALSLAASVLARQVYFYEGELTYFATAETSPGAFASTINFLPNFVFGMVMAKRIDQLKTMLASRNLAVIIALWVVSYLLIRRSQDIAMGLGSSMFLMLCLCNAHVERFMRAAPLQWLGTLSYSLYLLHIPVIAGCVYALHDRVPLPVILLCAATATFILADIFQRLVAEPAAAFGKYWANIVSPVQPRRSQQASIALAA